jgi:NNP family nitrate/nitrite transporter-like MFS transporter
VDDFPLFLGLLLALFFAAGIGNGSTFRMIPILFPAKQAAPVLGWTAAIAAYGAFILPFAFGAALARTGSPAVALWALVGFYLANAALCFFAYARPGASRPC